MRKDGNKWFTQWTRSMLRKANDPLSHSWSKIGRSSGSKSFQWLSLFLSFLLHRIALSNEAWGSLHSILLSSWLESLHRPSHSFILVPILTHLPLRSNQEHKQGGNQRKRYYQRVSPPPPTSVAGSKGLTVIYSMSLQRRGNRGIRSLIRKIDKAFSGSLSRK